RGGYSRSRSRSRGRDAGSPVAGREPKKALPVIIVYGVTRNVTPDHLREIFGQYGELGRVNIAKRGGSGSNRKPKTTIAMIDFQEAAGAHKAYDYMNGAMIDNETIRVKVDELGRRGSGRSKRGGRRRNGRRGGNGNRERDRRRRGLGGGGGRRYSRSPSPPMRGGPRGRRYSRSPPPYRKGRYSRDRRSPAMRPRSPDRYRGSGGGRYRPYSRSPSPRYGDYRSGRFVDSTTSDKTMLGRTIAFGRTLAISRPLWQAEYRRSSVTAAASLHSRQFRTSTRLRDHHSRLLTPTVVRACQEAMDKLKTRGLLPEDPSKAASMAFMVKLMRDPEAVEIIKQLMEKLKKEGVDANPASMMKLMEEFKQMSGKSNDALREQIKEVEAREKEVVKSQPNDSMPEKKSQKKKISDYFG
ncbi:hypothetical protein GGI23_007116, partial [Coemansia sp. RSA 2559]